MDLEAPGGEPGCRNSYDAFSPVWPGTTDVFPGCNAMPKYVVSTMLKEEDLVANWGEITISVHGSAELNRNLSDEGLARRSWRARPTATASRSSSHNVVE